MSLPESTIRKILTSKLHNANFTLVKSQLKTLSANGMMGEHFLLLCNIKDNLAADTITTTHKFFVKKKSVYTFDNIAHHIFKKEAATFQMFRSINHPDINQSLPLCYHIDDKHLIFEDLNQFGYKIQTPARVATDDELMVILDSLAAIHAGSIVFEEKNRMRLNEQFPDAFVELHFRHDVEIYQNWFRAIIKGLVTARSVFDLPEVLKNGKRFDDELETIIELLKKCEIPSSKKYRNTICQCDLWPANIFIKADEEKKPIHCKIIDYQMARYIPPAFDVLDVILLNTTREYPQDGDNFLRWKQLYFERFEKYLKENAVDSKKIYSLEEFLESFNEIEIYVMFIVLTTIPILYNTEINATQMLHSEKENTTLFVDRSPLIRNFRTNKYLMERIKGALIDLGECFERN